MARFVVRRFGWAVWLFFIATVLTYLIFFVVPGDPALIAAGSASLSPHMLARIRSELHLDLPIYQQYWIFLWNLIRHGSLGYSFVNGSSVRWIIGKDAPITASLVLGGAFFWILISLPVGVISALRPRSLLDRAGMVFVLIGISAPPVWMGLVLAYTFGFRLRWTPIADYCNFFPNSQIGICGGPARWAYHLLLPWLTFTLLYAAMYTRMIRAGVLEASKEDYVRTAQAKGASTRRVVVHHILRNSLLPVVTILGMDLGHAFGVALFVEEVFNLNGLGGELVGASLGRNLPVVVGIVVCVTVTVIVLNFLVDVAYAVLDPRIRLSS